MQTAVIRCASLRSNLAGGSKFAAVQFAENQLSNPAGGKNK